MTLTYGTLTLTPGHPVDVRLVRRALSTPAESGFVTARTLRANVSRQSGQPQTRVWSLVLGPDGYSELLASFDLAKGGALPLSWTPPPPDDAGGAVPVRFLTPLRTRRLPGGQFECELELEEVA